MKRNSAEDLALNMYFVYQEYLTIKQEIYYKLYFQVA